MKKKLLISLLAITALLCCIFGFTACNTPSLEFSPIEENGEVVAYEVTRGSGERITIPSTYKNKPVTAIGDGAFQEFHFGLKRLTYIDVPESVTSIGRSAFEGCHELWHITIPDSVTKIGAYAFYNCSRLTYITFPDSVTSIGEYAFNVSGLESIYFKGDLPSWCKISGMFDMRIENLYINGERLKGDLIIPEGVTSIGENAFYCEDITSVTIPYGVTEIGNCAFYNCTSLKSATIPDSVTTIGIETFEYCTNLTDITFSGTIGQWNAIERVSEIYQGSAPNHVIYYTVHCTDGDIEKPNAD